MPGIGGLPALRLDQLRQPVGTSLQPGSPGVVRARFVIVSGSGGGVFVYGPAGPGSPPLYQLSGATNDPYGTPVYPGIWAGQAGSVQVGMQAQPGSNFGILFFVVPGTFVGNAFLAGITGGVGQEVLEISGAQNTANPDPASDRMSLGFFDNASGGGSAAVQGTYADSSTGAQHVWLNVGFTGTTLNGVKSLNAVDPSTGTSSANPFAPETWHTMTLDAGWGSLGEPAQYMLLPFGMVALRGDISHAGTTVQTDINSGNPLPAAYRPAATRYYRPGQSADGAGAIEAQSTGVITMRASGFTATQAILDGIYSL